MLVFAKINCMKIITALIAIISGLFGGNMIIEEQTFEELIQNIEYVNVWVDGSQNTHINHDEILNEFEFLFQNSREMPAFGVALHDDTLVAMESGVWVELGFDKQYSHNDMPFEKLLINVEDCVTGFNVVRYNNGKYDGRCFYVDLVNCDTSRLYNELVL